MSSVDRAAVNSSGFHNLADGKSNGDELIAEAKADSENAMRDGGLVPPDAGIDADGRYHAEGPGPVRACIEAAETVEKREERESRPENADLVDKIEVAIARLAALSETAYQTVRKDEARHLKLDVRFLDRRVKAGRNAIAAAAMGAAKAPSAGTKPSGISTLEPWPEAVVGGEVLEELTVAFKKHVVMKDEEALTASLWDLHAHTHDAAVISPILMLKSAEKRCGKTTAMKLLKSLTPESLMASNLTASSVFRVVDRWRPTLIVDEADTFLKSSEQLRGVLNSGHDCEGAYVVRTVKTGKGFEERTFSTWAPKAIALIGAPPDTIDDRSITIKLRRKLKSEKVTSLRSCAQDIRNLGRKAARWAADFREALRERDPTLPEELHDRAKDNWRPLLAIADQIGGDWAEKARKAALVIEDAKQDAEPDTNGTRLLSDCRIVFSNRKFKRGEPEALKIGDLIEAICNLEESSWREYHRGKRITEVQFGRLLSPYDIKSEVRRDSPPPRARKWYKDRFLDAWNRYLPPADAESTRDTRTALKDKDNLPVTEGEAENPVTGEKCSDFNDVTPNTGFSAPSGDDICDSGDSGTGSAPSANDGGGSAFPLPGDNGDEIVEGEL